MESTQSSLNLLFDNMIENVYEVFEDSILSTNEITLAYSGGKDSTLLALLFYEWIKQRRETPSLNLTLMHNDTSSEIDPMEDWAMGFMAEYKRKIENISRSKVSIQVRRPEPIDTFYWRAIIRGYPAPSFNFRWCVHLLKEKPSKIDSIEGRVMTGLRDQESAARSFSMKKKYGKSCGATPGGCMAYYYSSEGKGNKIAPFRDWADGDVWSYLTVYRSRGDFDIKPLFNLYKNPKVRYGCWHCTLASVQWGLHSLDDGLSYFEAVRILYRKISDLHYLRKRKKWGYSKLGPLNAVGRTMLLRMISIAEELSGIRLYGLDNNMVGSHSLREILYDLDPIIATRVIRRGDPKIAKNRYVSIKRVRDIARSKDTIRRALEDVKKEYVKERSYRMLQQSGRDPFKKIIEKLLEEISQ